MCGDTVRKKDDEKQKSIKQAVVQIILEEGFHGASVSKIARAAGVSPATVYIYYENKESMLRDIYQEYAEATFGHLMGMLSVEQPGPMIIDTIIRQYYHYILSNEEIFNFVEQFSNCKALSGHCAAMKGPTDFDTFLTELKVQGILKPYQNDNIYAILFYPVKAIANKSCGKTSGVEERLEELIKIIQDALLRNNDYQ